MPAEEMPPRAGKGARGRGGGRPPRGGPFPPASDSINWARSFRRGGGRGRGRRAGRGPAEIKGRDRRPGLGAGDGGGGGGSSALPRAPHRCRRPRGDRGGPVNSAALASPPPSITHLGARIWRPNSGWARARPPRRVCAWVVPGSPARALFTSIPLVTGARRVGGRAGPFPSRRGGARAAPPTPDRVPLGRLPGFPPPPPGDALPPHPGRGLFRGVIGAIHLSGAREVAVPGPGCGRRSCRTSRRARMRFP